jgi:hypothetical protein
MRVPVTKGRGAPSSVTAVERNARSHRAGSAVDDVDDSESSPPHPAETRSTLATSVRTPRRNAIPVRRSRPGCGFLFDR